MYMTNHLLKNILSLEIVQNKFMRIGLIHLKSKVQITALHSQSALYMVLSDSLFNEELLSCCTVLLSDAPCCWLSSPSWDSIKPAGIDDSDLAAVAHRLSEMTRGSSKAAFDGIICWKMYWCTLYCRQLAQEAFWIVNKLKGVVRCCKLKESLLRVDR